MLAAVATGQRDLPRRPITLLYWAWAISAFAMIGFGVSQAIWHAMLASFVMESGITILLVTHELDIARCANRIIQFRDGQVVFDQRIEKPQSATEALANMPARQQEARPA